MGQMIEDMLDLARARLAGGFTLKCAPADFGALIQRVVREHQAAFPQHRIEVSTTGDVTGEWDAERLAQVGSNLIGNALQHGKGNEPVQVRLDGTQLGVVVFSVTNAGSIPPEVLPYLFDPFRGGERHLGRNEGLGLGLYIVQQIVKAHQGDVEVEPPDATHTTFRVTIPRRVVL
jgi:signal transduction histidine kinase